MTTGNFADDPAAVPPATPAPRRFRLPADYYAAPASENRPMFAKWVPFGCGTASIVFLIVLTAGGTWLSHHGIGRLLDLGLAPMAKAIPGIYSKDVADADRRQLEAELATFREHVRANRVSAPKMQPVLQKVQGMIGDQKMTADEVRDLTAELRKANGAAAH